MALSVKRAIRAHEVLVKLANLVAEKGLFLLTSVRIRIAQNLRKTTPVYEDFMQKKQELFARLGDKTDESTYTLPPDHKNRAEFNQEFAAALDEVTEIESLRKITEYELAGVSKDDYENPGSSPKPQNQVPIDLIIALDDLDLLEK